jgi:hypothetical protein
MRKVSVEDAVGMVLGHDVTKIVPGTFKGPGFKRGHVIRREDIPELLRLGKEHIYVMKLRKGELHEDDAARRLSRAFSGPGIEVVGPSEGKMKLVAEHAGLLSIDVSLVERINTHKGIALSTRHDNTPVRKGWVVAATRVIPLTISEQRVLRVETLCKKRPGKVISVWPYQRKDVGVLVTGNEIYRGRIRDRFDDYVGVKITRYKSRIIKKLVAPDDEAFIARSLTELVQAGSDLILVTAGLSVDPDDVTLRGVRRAGARVVSYGSPVMPGSMFLYAHLGQIPVLGLPACVFHHPTTVFDLIFPRVLADQTITRKDIARLGHGGLCLDCAQCRYPDCPFGKG